MVLMHLYCSLMKIWYYWLYICKGNVVDCFQLTISHQYHNIHNWIALWYVSMLESFLFTSALSIFNTPIHNHLLSLILFVFIVCYTTRNANFKTMRNYRWLEVKLSFTIKTTSLSLWTMDLYALTPYTVHSVISYRNSFCRLYHWYCIERIKYAINS